MPPITYPPNGQQTPDIPPEMMAAIMAQFAPPPSYSTSKGYLPPSLEQSQKQLNYGQDLYGSLLNDPMWALLAGPSSYTDASMIGQKPDAGNTAGVQAMQDLIANPASAGSAEAQIAARILDGKAPSQAVSEVAALRSDMTDPDTGKLDSQWTKLAQDFYKQKSEYRAPSGPQNAYQAAGLYDPSVQFTPQMLGGQEMSKSKAAVDKAQQVMGQTAKLRGMASDYKAKQSAYEQAMRDWEAKKLAADKSYTSDSASRRSGVNVTIPDIAPYVPGMQAATYRAPLDLSVGDVGPAPVAPTPPMLGGRQGPLDWGKLNQQLAYNRLDLNNAKADDSMARLMASAQARSAQQQYGTPMMMQVAQRLAAMRQATGMQ